MMASAGTRTLVQFGVANDFQSDQTGEVGPWYGDPRDSPLSCRRLSDVVTEFGAQGLELDAVLLAWGTDLMMEGGSWSNLKARGYMRGVNT